MRLRYFILKTEGKLLWLYIRELFFLNPVVFVLAVESPLILGFLFWADGGAYLVPVLLYFLLPFLAGIAIRKALSGHDRPPFDPPLIAEISDHPRLRELVANLASRLGRRRSPIQLRLTLSPASWQQFGVDPAGHGLPKSQIALAVACLDTWSISELEAHVARSIVLRRGPVKLIREIEWSIERLQAAQYQEQFQRGASSSWLAQARGRALERFVAALAEWKFLVDLEADVAAAAVVGPEPVMSLLYKNELAQTLVPEFIQTVVDPALEKQVLLPIASSYAAYASAVDPLWRDAVTEALRLAEQDSSPDSGPLTNRLRVLAVQPHKVSMQDPRLASSVFPELLKLEQAVAVNEFPLERGVLAAQQAGESELLRLFVFPHLEELLERNGKLLDQKTWFDIPSLLTEKSKLAVSYKAGPRFLLAPVQKEQQIVYLLGAFLTMSLIAEQWEPSFAVSQGVQLRRGSRQIQPFALVSDLDCNNITVQEFEEAVR